MDRSTRCELMAQLDDPQLDQIMAKIGGIEATIVNEPTVGMLMMRVLEDAHGETFNLGEVLVTECLVRVEDSEGWAMLLGSRTEGARMAATIDASLDAFPERAPSIEQMLLTHAADLKTRQNAHFARLAPTRVQFDTQ